MLFAAPGAAEFFVAAGTREGFHLRSTLHVGLNLRFNPVRLLRIPSVSEATADPCGAPLVCFSTPPSSTVRTRGLGTDCLLFRLCCCLEVCPPLLYSGALPVRVALEDFWRDSQTVGVAGVGPPFASLQSG